MWNHLCTKSYINSCVEYLSCWRGWRTCRRTSTTHQPPATPQRTARWTCVLLQAARRGSVRYNYTPQTFLNHSSVLFKTKSVRATSSCIRLILDVFLVVFVHLRCLRCSSTLETTFWWMHPRIQAHWRRWEHFLYNNMHVHLFTESSITLFLLSSVAPAARLQLDQRSQRSARHDTCSPEGGFVSMGPLRDPQAQQHRPQDPLHHPQRRKPHRRLHDDSEEAGSVWGLSPLRSAAAEAVFYEPGPSD